MKNIDKKFIGIILLNILFCILFFYIALFAVWAYEGDSGHGKAIVDWTIIIAVLLLNVGVDLLLLYFVKYFTKKAIIVSILEIGLLWAFFILHFVMGVY